MSKELLDSLMADITAGDLDSFREKALDLTDEQVNAIFESARPSYKSLGTASTEKHVIATVRNLREQYQKKLITTAMCGFLFQMKDEYLVDESDLTSPPNKEDFMYELPSKLPDNFNEAMPYNEQLQKKYSAKFPEGDIANYKLMEAELDENELLEVSIAANEQLEKLKESEKALDAAKYDAALDASIKKQSADEKEIIDRYLKRLFKYDVNVHSQEGKHPINNDPERVDPDELKGTHAVYDNIPPNDTHCRFNWYYNINYEKMIEATNNIYCIKPDLDEAVIVYDVVDTKEEVDAFLHKYGAASKVDIISFNLNTWTLIGPFAENRERANYYNKHNEVIKAMLTQQETDAALGEELMKNRVRTTKQKAEKVFGKDSPEFEEYRQMNPSDLESKFNAKISENSEECIRLTKEVVLDADTGKELTVDEDGIPQDALEIPITHLNARSGDTSQTRIFTRSGD